MELYPFQRENVDYITAKRRVLLADPMGLGKSASALVSVETLSAYPTVVVCPASLKLNWVEECRKWVPDHSAAILDGRGSPNVPVPAVDVVILNYEILPSWLEALRVRNPQAIIGDEAHYLKTRNAQRTKAFHELCCGRQNVILLTGTPVLNRPAELIEPLKILGKLGTMGGWYPFVTRYCDGHQVMRPRRGVYGRSNLRPAWDISGASHTDELHRRLNQVCMIRHRREDVLPQLPGKRRFSVVLPRDGSDLYEEAESAFISEAIDTEEPPSRMAMISLITKLKLAAAKAKLPAVTEWVQNALETGEKLLLFAWHQEIQRALHAAFPGSLHLSADLSVEDRQATVEAFQQQASHPLLVSSLAIGGLGFNIPACHRVAFAELGWNPAVHDQAEDRCHRIGQTEDVSAWYLLATGTIEEDIARLVDRKRAVVNSVSDGIEDDLITELKGKFAGRARQGAGHGRR